MGDEEKRRYPRYPGGAIFSGAGPGGRIHAASANQGPGGAFLESVEPMRPDSRVYLTVHDPFERDQPVVLIARVTHATTVPTTGVGLEWLTAVCQFGLDRLKKFLDAHFHLLVDPQRSGAHVASELTGCVSYDFKYGTVEPTEHQVLEELEHADTFYGLKLGGSFLPKAQFMEVKVQRSGGSVVSAAFRRESGMDLAALDHMTRYGHGEAPPTGPVAMEPADKALPMTDEERDAWRWDLKRRRRASLPAEMTVSGKRLRCVVTHLARDAVFLMYEGEPASRDDRVVLEIQATVGVNFQRIVLVADVTRVVRDRKQGRVGVDTRVVSIDEGKNPGFFDQLLLAL